MRRTPLVAVPIGVLTNTGRDRHARRSSAEPTKAVSGWGIPRAPSVADAETLSCTARKASNGGTAVGIPASASRPAECDSTATCSCVGKSRSNRPRRYTARAASSQPSGSAP